MAVQDYKINYKSDFVLNINGDAGWAIPFCIKFWTGMPSQAYFVGFDGVKYVNCKVGDTPTQLLVMFDDHHLPIGKLKMQIAYHTTIAEFPGSVFDEVTNARDVIVTIDGTDYQVMLDFTGEDAPELEFDLPAYANEAERIQNELQRQQNEADRIAAELQREQASAAAVQGAENVNAQLSGNILTVTNRNGVSTSVNTKGEQGVPGPAGPEGPQGEQGISIVDFSPKSQTATTLIYTATFSDGHTQDVAIPKGPKGDTGATGPTGPQGPQGDTGVSITGMVKTGETSTDTLYNITFSNGTTQQVAIPKGEKGDQGPQGPVGPQGPMGDVAVITPEQQAAFTMYSEPGPNTNGPMTQKAVTDEIGKVSVISIPPSSLSQLANWTGNLGHVVTTAGAKHINIPLEGYSYVRMVAGTFICYYVFASAVNGNSWTPVASYRYEIPTGENSGNIKIPAGATHLIVGIVYNGTDSPDCTPSSIELISSNAKNIEDTIDSNMPTSVSISKSVADANYYYPNKVFRRLDGVFADQNGFDSYIIPIMDVLSEASYVYIQRNKASTTTYIFGFLSKIPAINETMSYVGEQVLIDNSLTDTYQGLSVIGEHNFSLNKIAVPTGAKYLYVVGNQTAKGYVDTNKYPEALILDNTISNNVLMGEIEGVSNAVSSMCLNEKLLVQGSTMNVSGVDATDAACVRTPYLPLGNKTSVIVYNNHTLDDGYQLYFKHTWYDSNKTFVSVSAWTYEAETPVPSGALGGYDRLVIRRMKATTPVASTVPTDIAMYKLYLNIYGYNGVENRVTMAESSLNGIMKGLSPRTLTVASWNIGHFSLGMYPNSTITGSNYATKLAAFKELVYNTINPRLISLNEYSLVFGTDSGSVEHNARDVLFNDFGVKWEGAQMNYSCNAVYGNVYLDNIKFRAYECLRNAVITHSSDILATDYYYVIADLYLEGRLVKFITTHMAFDNNYPSVLQEAQMAELVNVLSGYDRALVMGDFNVAAQSDFDAFVNAGYTLGNGGTVITYPSSSKCLDNIIVKGLTLSNFRAITDSLSDHYPIAAEISL